MRTKSEDAQVIKAAQAIEKHMNNLCLDEEALAKELTNMHRTLQQTFMRVVIKFIEEMANQEYSDLRNEASVELAKKIVAAVPERYLPMY